MNPIYVARRAFKSRGVLYEVGQVIEDPSSVTLLRSRIGSRDVLELYAGDVRNRAWLDYFSTRVQGPLDSRLLEVCGKVVEKAPAPAPTQEPAKPAPAKTATATKTKASTTAGK